MYIYVYFNFHAKDIEISDDWNDTSKGIRPVITINPDNLAFIK